jgi:hypothetical protein
MKPRQHPPPSELKLVQQLTSGEKRPARRCREHHLSQTYPLNGCRTDAECGKNLCKASKTTSKLSAVNATSSGAARHSSASLVN